jgi:hypothetical protein
MRPLRHIPDNFAVPSLVPTAKRKSINLPKENEHLISWSPTPNGQSLFRGALKQEENSQFPPRQYSRRRKKEYPKPAAYF